MLFINPLFLIGLGGLAVPIILHLLLRDRPKRLVLPTLRFLPATAPQSYAMHRVKNIVLLMLRLLILLLIVLAFARPYIRTHETLKPGVVADEGVVFAVDQSLSMRAGDRWDSAVNRVRTLGRASGSNTRFALMLFDKKPEIACGDTSDLSRVEAALKGKTAGYGSTDLMAAIRSASDSAEKMKARKKKVYLISDFQDSGMHQLALDMKLPGGVELVPIQTGGKPAPNLAISGGIECACSTPGLRHVRITADAYGGANISARLRLLDGRNVLAEKNVTLSEDEHSVTEFDINLPLDKEHIVKAEIAANDGLKEDNELDLLLKAQKPLPVAVLVTMEGMALDPENGSAFRGSNPYLQAAILACDPLIAPKWIDASQVASLSPKQYPVAILHIEKGLPESAIQNFLKYVKTGGSLIIFPGIGEDASLEKIIGARLSGWESVDPATDRYRLVTTSATNSPISLLDESGRTLLGHPKAFRYLRIEQSPSQDLHKLISFDNGSAFLMERKTGRGRIYLLTVPLRPDASDLVLRAAFTPFLYQLISYCSTQSEEKREFRVGEVYAPQDMVPGEKPTLTNPRRQTTVLDGKSRPLRMPGVYSVRQGEKDIQLVVRVDEKESDLRPMDPMRIRLLAMKGQQNRLQDKDLRELAGIGGSIQEDAPPADAQHRIWWYLLAAAFVLMLGETLLASRTSR